MMHFGKSWRMRYSRDEYVEVSEKLTSALKLVPPLEACAEVARWTRESERLRDLVSRHSTLAYGDMNIPIQLLLPAGTDAAIKAWADGTFKKVYGVMPDEFQLL